MLAFTLTSLLCALGGAAVLDADEFPEPWHFNASVLCHHRTKFVEQHRRDIAAYAEATGQDVTSADLVLPPHLVERSGTVKHKMQPDFNEDCKQRHPRYEAERWQWSRSCINRLQYRIQCRGPTLFRGPYWETFTCPKTFVCETVDYVTGEVVKKRYGQRKDIQCVKMLVVYDKNFKRDEEGIWASELVQSLFFGDGSKMYGDISVQGRARQTQVRTEYLYERYIGGGQRQFGELVFEQGSNEELRENQASFTIPEAGWMFLKFGAQVEVSGKHSEPLTVSATFAFA